jgi:ComF family protein
VDAVILADKQARIFAGITEAVFSSSGDRIRAIQAKAAMAGPSIASVDSPSWANRVFIQVAESLFAVLFPSDCRICGTPLAEISRLPVCRECLGAMQPISGGLCAICGERLFSSHALSPAGDDNEPQCGLCRRIEPPFARAIAYGSYDGGLRELIHLLKYASVRPAANVLGRMLAEAIAELQPDFADDQIAVIPVPLYRAKLRRREFNHAEVIARAAIKLSSDTIRLRLCPEVLVRKRKTPSQTGLTRHQRRENVRGAFGVAQAEVVKGREVLVVDDVYTTGATVSECARVLRRAGATKVWVATVARTLKIAEQHVEIRLPDEADVEISGAQEVPLARAAGI